MDIPQVLETLFPNKYWGSMANSDCTYEQFAAHWPQQNGSVPTKERMEEIWREIQRVPKSKEEIEQSLNDWLGNDSAKLQKLIVALTTSCLETNPNFLEQFNIPVCGDKKNN